MRTITYALVLLASVAATSAFAAEAEKEGGDTRAGNCEDAKKQMEYFCATNPNDTMVAIGTACTNAKNNVKAACEGIVEADKKYEFDDKK